MTGDALSSYRALLGVKPEAGLDEIRTAYYLLLEKVPENPTEEEEERQQKIQRAYAVLRRASGSREPVSVAADYEAPSGEHGRSAALAVASAVVLAATLLAVNLSGLGVALTGYEPGDVLRLKDREAPYGTVVGFDPSHRFHAGGPTAAYQIRLADKDEVVWLSERVVDKGMVKLDGAGAPSAP